VAEVDEWSQLNWQPVSLNLAEVGVPPTAAMARLRFSLVADAEGSDKGWIIDDVTLTGSSAPAPPLEIYLPLIAK
jgi:hypothetical protein